MFNSKIIKAVYGFTTKAVFRSSVEDSLSPDLYKPIMEKMVINYTDGSARRVVCGLFDYPLEIITKSFIVANKFDEYGSIIKQDVRPKCPTQNRIGSVKHGLIA
jgi:hypothetical protein